MKNTCKFIKLLSFVFIIVQIRIFNLYSQVDKEFWFVAPEVSVDHACSGGGCSYPITPGGEPIKFVFTSIENEATVLIEMPQNSTNFPDTTINVPAGQTVVWDLTHRINEVENIHGYSPTLGNLGNKGIHIVSDEDITVYYESGQENNCDLFSLKGANALGTEFFTSFQNRHFNVSFDTWTAPAYSKFDVVFTEPNTYLTIEIPVNNTLLVGPSTYTNTTVTFGPFQPGQTFTGVSDWVNNPNSTNSGGVYHSSNDIYGRSAADHLAGLRLTTNGKKIAVTLSDDSMKSLSGGCYDLGGDQTIPVDILGKEYVAIRGQLDVGISNTVNTSWYTSPSSGTTVYNEAVYITATDNNTDIEINGSIMATLGRGETYLYEIDKTEPYTFINTADSAIYVLHVSGFGCEMGEAILPPIDKCTGSPKVSFTRSVADATNNDGKNEFFLNILSRKGYEDKFKLNGASTTLIEAGDFINIPEDTNWSYARIGPIPRTDIDAGSPYILENSDVFHLGIINGGSSGGTRYGYFSGFNEVKVDAFISGSGNFAYGCKNDPIQLEVSGGDSCVWDPITYLSNPFITNPILTITGNETFLEYTATIEGYCKLKDTKKIQVQMLGNVTADFSMNKIEGCSPLTVTFKNISVGGKYFKWDLNGDGIYDDRKDTIPTEPYTANYSFLYAYPDNNSDTVQVINISLTAKGAEGCHDTITRTIEILPSVTPQITKNLFTSECHPSAYEISNVTNTLIDTVNYIWNLSDGYSSNDSTFTHNFLNLGNTDTSYVITLKAITKHECEYYAYDTVTIHPRVKSNFSIDKTNFCSPDSVLITNQSIGPNLKYSWDFGNSESLITNNKNTFYQTYDTTDVSYSQSNLENFTIQLAIEDTLSTCTDTTSQLITVKPGIEAYFTPSTDQNGLSPLEIQFTNTSLTNFATTSFDWDFSDGNNSNDISPLHTFFTTTPGGSTYNVSMIATTPYNCIDTATSINVTVSTFIKAKININKTSGCSPFTVKLVNASQGSNHEYTWDFGNGDDTIMHSKDTFWYTYQVSPDSISIQNYKIKLTVEDTISHAIAYDSVTVSVYPPSSASFTSVYDTAGCQPFTVDYSNTSSSSALQFNWEFSDGGSSNSASPSHTFVNTDTISKTFTSRLITETVYGCKDTTGYETYSVSPPIDAQISIDTSNGCHPFNAKIYNNSLGADIFTWTMDDGNTFDTSSMAFQYQYMNTTTATKTYTISLLVENTTTTCKDSIKRNINVYPEAIAGFNQNYYNGCHPLPVNFNNTSNSVAIRYKWDFGDGSSSSQKNPVHYFQNIGTDSVIYPVTLISESEHYCSDTISSAVTVMPSITAGLNVDTASGCQPLDVKLYNNSIRANTYNWYFDNSLLPDTITYDSLPFHISFPNHTDTVKNIKIKLTAINSDYGYCLNNDSLYIEVYPEIISDFSPKDYNGCHPLPVNFINASNSAALRYKWDFGDGNTSTDENPVHYYHNISTDSVVYPVTLISESEHYCSDTVSSIITVMPAITASFYIDTAIGCQPLDIALYNNSIRANRYEWYIDDIPYDTTYSLLPFNISVPNETETIRNSEIKLVAINTDYGHCLNTDSMYIQVYPVITAGFTPSVNRGCQPLSVQFTNNSNNVATNFIWDFGDGNTSSNFTPTHVYHNIGADSIVNTVILISESDHYCTDTAFLDIMVMPYIKAAFNMDTTRGCQPLNVTLYNNSEGADTYEWYLEDVCSPYKITNSTNPFSISVCNKTDTLKNAIVKLIAISEEFGNCISSDSLFIDVYPRIIADFSLTDSVSCHPFIIDITNNSIGATSLTTPYRWDLGDGYTSTQFEPNHNYYNIDTEDLTYTINLQVTSQYKCTDQLSKSITVHPYINALFTSDIKEGCPDLEVNFTNLSTSTATEFEWDFGDGCQSNTQNPQHKFVNDDPLNDSEFTVKLTAIDDDHGGCYSVCEKNITVFAKPNASFTPKNSAGCNPYKLTFSDESQGTSLEYFWDFGNNITSTSANPSVTFSNTNPDKSKNYKVMFTITSSDYCTDTDSTVIEIYPYIESSFKLDEYGGCTPFTINIENLSKGATAYDWNYGDGKKDNEKSLKFNYKYEVDENQEITDYIIQLIASNIGCADTFSQQVNVYPNVVAGFDTFSGCSPLTETLKNTSQGYNLSYKWDFDDGGSSSKTSPVHTFINSGTSDIVKNISITATSEYGCYDVFSASNTIYANPISAFTLEKSAECSPFTVQITNNSSAGNYIWDFGDGITKELETGHSVTHLFKNTGKEQNTYTITLITTNENNCKDTISQPINVYPEVTAKFSSSDTKGCNPYDVDFYNETEELPTTSALWYFDDGSYSRLKDANHIFVNEEGANKTFNVKLKVESRYGCHHTDSMNITVYPNPEANFSVSPEKQIYPDATISIQNLTNEGFWNYTWDFGDGSQKITGNITSYEYADWGDVENNYEYNITLIVDNIVCKDTVIKSITILPHEPIASFSTSTLAGCPPLKIQFTNTSEYANNRLIWDFGDSTYQTNIETPLKTYHNPGDYFVKLTAYGDAGVDETTKKITVYQDPISLFEILTPKVELFDDSVKILNLSSHADFYSWNFGDETTSSEYQPVHFYEKEGTYTVSLKVETKDGCMDFYEIKNAIRAEEPCKIIYPNAFTPCLDGPCSDKYQVDNDKSDNTFHPYYQDGVETDEYSLTIYNRWGEIIFYTDDYYQAWTGYYKNKLVEQGVYVYQVRCRCTNGDEIYFINNVTVFH